MLISDNDEVNRILGISQQELPKIKRDLNQKKEKKSKKKKKTELPSVNEIKDWFGHIKEIKIEFFMIESNIEPFCGYCEAWVNNKLERKYIRRIHELIGLDESSVFYEEIPCDWNCLHGEEYVDRESKVIKQYPLDIDFKGENYFVGYGMDIEYFPAIRIQLTSKAFKKGNEILELVLQGLGNKVEKTKRYSIFGKEYVRKKIVKEVHILKPLLKFFRSLNISDSKIPIHEKFSILLGQYHRNM